MYKKDYFMRLVEQLTAVISQIANLGDKEAYDEALETTDSALRQLTGLGVNAWLSMDTADIMANLSMRDDLGGVETAVFMAGIFYQQGEIKAWQGKDDAADYCLLKALDLQLALFNTHPDIPMPEVLPAVTDLQDRLEEADVALPPETSLALLTYYESLGEFAEADNVLFEWIDVDLDSGQAVETAVAFYSRLLQKTDEELLAGGLSRAEVEDGLEEVLAE